MITVADTSSPRATLTSFQRDCESIYESVREGAGEERDLVRLEARVLSCLDLSDQPEYMRRKRGGQAAAYLKEVLDRVPLPPMAEIRGAAELDAAEGGAVPARWRIPRTNIEITRMKEGAHEGAWLFSAETVAMLPEFFSQVRDLPYKPGATEGFYEWYQSHPGPWLAGLVGLLPDGMRTTFVGGHAMWQWFGLGISLSLAIGVMIGVYLLGRRWALRERKRSAIGYALTLALPASAMLVPLIFSAFVRNQLRFSGAILESLSFITGIVFLIGAMIVIVGAGTRFAEVLISNPRINTKGLDAQLIRIVFRILSLVAATFVFLEGGTYLGIPLSTLLASAGVGGLALALAAQDSLKNFFGSIMIILDKPFRVGERILIGDFDGIVEEIGLRSTKLRLLSGHQATIPNEEMARSHIENIGRRPHIRRLTDIRLPLDMPTEKASEAVRIVEGILEDHEGQEGDLLPRVNLTDIGADALNLKVVYWFHPPDYWAYLAHCQRVNLEIKQSFEEAGIRFALPTTQTQLVESGGMAGWQGAGDDG